MSNRLNKLRYSLKFLVCGNSAFLLVINFVPSNHYADGLRCKQCEYSKQARPTEHSPNKKRRKNSPGWLYDYIREFPEALRHFINIISIQGA